MHPTPPFLLLVSAMGDLAMGDLMRKQALILSGPIGVGKSTIGAAVAQRLGGVFIESDLLGDPALDWHQKIEAVNAGIIQKCLRVCNLAVVSLPLVENRFNQLGGALGKGVTLRCITLAASYEAIVSPTRGRVFEDWELARIKEMIADGYNRRGFSEAIVRTDELTVETATLAIVSIIANPRKGVRC